MQPICPDVQLPETVRPSGEADPGSDEDPDMRPDQGGEHIRVASAIENPQPGSSPQPDNFGFMPIGPEARPVSPSEVDPSESTEFIELAPRGPSVSRPPPPAKPGGRFTTGKFSSVQITS